MKNPATNAARLAFGSGFVADCFICALIKKSNGYQANHAIHIKYKHPKNTGCLGHSDSAY
jgi:hypothetical protein